MLAFWTVSALVLPLSILASPVLEARQSVVTLTAAEIAAFTPYAYLAAAAGCNPNATRTWTCGNNCNNAPGFIPVATGGNGDSVQFWYVGYSPSLQTVIVGHQGTDTNNLLPILTDANFFLSSLSTSLFPGLSSSVQVHSGFEESQADTATAVLAAVRTTIASHGATKVTTVGHSLGGAIATIDAVYLKLNLPSTITVASITFGTPRVGNQAFANWVDANLPGQYTHVNNKEDIVPILPGRFLGFHHPSGEKHILSSGAWVACAGQDNTNAQCTTGQVSNIFDGNPNDHSGPYGPVRMTCSA